jgi:hypothetical protein
MPDQLDNSAPFDDDQGTRSASEPTGAGAEATSGMDGEPKGSSHTHESGYGGKAGKPKESNGRKDFPRSRR